MARWNFTRQAQPHAWNRSNRQMHCPSCGAPVISEVCGYCGASTGLNTAKANMEYPVIDCKEATINLMSVFFPGMFAVCFGFFGITMLITGITERDATVSLAAIPFTLIGVIAASLVVQTVLRYIKVKIKGKTIRATVYGYMDDNMLINGMPAQVVKLLVQTPNGPRFIMYQLKNTSKPYRINSNIDIMVYENYFMICKNKEVVQW